MLFPITLELKFLFLGKKLSDEKSIDTRSYFEINHKVIWMTITEDIPRLIAELENFFDTP
jgi:uncharacterized protein with HEPN domain